MDRKWFRRFGIFYFPVSVTGWALTLLTGFISVRTFLMVDERSHSASDTLIAAGPIIAVLVLLFWLLAARSSNSN